MISEWVGIVVGVFGLILAVAGAMAYARSVYAKETINIQDGEIKARDQKIERMEAERQEFNDRIATLERQVEGLTNIVTARPQIERLATETLRQHKEVIQILNEIATSLKQSTEAQRDGVR